MSEHVLHIELSENASPENMTIKMKGDSVLLSTMIATAMNERQEIARVITVAVMAWANKNNIWMEMQKFPK